VLSSSNITEEENNLPRHLEEELGAENITYPRAFRDPHPADLRIVEGYSCASCDGRPYAHDFFANCIEIGKLIEELSVDFFAR
jgi:hypothetical protein